MNEGFVREKFDNLPLKRKEVLLRILAGEMKAKIALEVCKGSENAVQQHLRQLYKDFQITVSRENKLPTLQNLFFQKMPELFQTQKALKSDPEIKGDRHSLRQLPKQNLPLQTNEFIGRETEIKQLLEQIDLNYRAPFITVDGIGGVGKTALVVEVAYRCWEYKQGFSAQETPKFDAIIFTTAKENKLLPSGIVSGLHRQSTLRDIFREIAQTLDDQSIIQVSSEEQIKRVKNSLSEQQTLLIVDNLETIENQNDVLAFLDNLPFSTKAIITTRDVVPRYSSLSLRELPEVDSIQLIKQQIAEKNLILSEDEVQALYQRFGGVPVALIYGVGMLASRYPLDILLDDKTPLPDDVARFCFASSIQPLRDKSAHKLLMAAAIFPYPPVLEALAAVAGLTSDPIAVNQGLAKLLQLSLIRQETIEEQTRYSMLALTREYALAELAAYPEFEKEVRERWVNWYLDFANKYGGYLIHGDVEWHLKFDYLEKEWGNFLEILAWCAKKDFYEKAFTLWQQQLRHFADLYGYWEDHLYWSEWFIEASKRRGEWTNVANTMANQAWIYIRINSPHSLKQAEPILKSAWELKENIAWRTQFIIACNLGVLFIYQNKFLVTGDMSSDDWLEIRNKIWDDHEYLVEEKSDCILTRLNGNYWQAYSYFSQGKYAKAEKLLKDTIKGYQNSNHQRGIIYAQNILADIAIIEGNFNEAENLLNTGLPVAERNKDKRRTALYQKSFANLEKAKNNPDKAVEWATIALEGFKRLGMTRDANEMRELIAELKVEEGN